MSADISVEMRIQDKTCISYAGYADRLTSHRAMRFLSGRFLDFDALVHIDHLMPRACRRRRG